MNSQLQTINFYDRTLTTFEQNGTHYAAMKPICENIGLNWASQYQRIQRDEVLSQGVVIITTPSNGGDQQMICLPIDYLNGWLFGIDVKRVKPEIRGTLITYKKECYKALHDYWVNGKAERKSAVRIEKLSQAHQITIKELVLGRVKNLPKEQQASVIIKQWSALKTHFGKSYKDIDDSQFTEAVSLLARLPLEGELIIDEPKTERMLNLNSDGVNAMINCFYSATRMQEAVSCLLTNLRTFRSNTLDSVRFNYEVMEKYIKETQPHVEQLVKQRYKPKTPRIGNQKRLSA